MTEYSGDPVAGMLADFAQRHHGARVLDVGGGSGARAVPLAQAGCRVLVVDSSTDALASLGRRAAEAGVSDRVEAMQADADGLGAVLEPETVDLVLYHHVVQEVEDPARSLRDAVSILRPGGTLSILVPGRLSAVLVEALAGRYDVAGELLRGGVGADRLYDVPTLRWLLEQADLAVASVSGVGVLAALSGDRALVADGGAVATLERDLGRHAVLGQIAGDLHAVAVRPVG